MAKTSRTKAAGERQVLVHYDQALPEIPDRLPHELPSSYLEKDGKGGYRIVSGRRPSKLLLVPKIRQVVDAWRANGYKGASDTSERLLQYWFGSGHRLNDGREFNYYFGQREAIETLIFIHEVKGITDAADLILGYMDEAAYGNDIFVTRKQIVEDIRGKRRLQRLVPDTGQMADQAIPPEKLPRYAVKMATGSGKTVVMALAVAWSYFHRRFEQGSDLARRFLLLAPNIIVYERLKTDFENETIFRDLPIIPPEWKHEWDFRTVLRGESYSGSASGCLYLTNIQQLYDRGGDDEPINPIDMVLGPRVKTDGMAKSASILEMVQEHDDLIVINDEAHHVHDEELEWWRVIESLQDRLLKRTDRGLVAQLDFTATPKDRNGTFFPWIVSDYPLAQAVEDKIVKAPLVVHQTERADPQTYSNAAVAYQEWIQIALSRWREHRKAYKPVGIKPVLFVMAEDTRDADAIAESIRREPDIKDEEVLVIHVKERGNGKGDIAEMDLAKAREAARSIDLPGNKIKVVVSVLMLREGWDVRNVTVILGLRPFTSDAKILPEQAVGRGLRLMRDMHPDYAQVVEIVGTPKFEEFVKSLEIEGVGVASTKTPPSPGVPIYPMKERAKYDIEVPQLSQTYSRNYKDMASFDINALPASVVPLKGSPTSATEIEIRHGLTEVTVATGTVDYQPDGVFLQDVLAHITQSVIRTAKLGCKFTDIYPVVEKYVAERFFDVTVSLNDPVVARALARHDVGTPLVKTLAEALGKHATQTQKTQLKPEPIRLSETHTFTWRRLASVATHTIFNQVACYNQFEADFAVFLDNARDVNAFGKLAEWFTGFGLEYLSANGSVRIYYPDFVASVEDDGQTTMWLLETKGREDFDSEVSRKDAHAEWWCSQVTAQSGVTWKYAKLPYRRFHAKWPQTFAQLIEMLKPAPGLSLIFEPNATTTNTVL
jgi:type III restriction enzyme